MGKTDRLIRLIIALAISVLWFEHILNGTFGVIALTVACIFLLTSVMGNCPIYSIFGINTCSAKGPTRS